MSKYTKEFVESVRGFIFDKALTLFKQQSKSDQLLSMETWDPIFEKIHNEIRFYSDIEQEKEKEQTVSSTESIALHTLYPSETYNDYIQKIGSLQRLGAYDYTEFYRKMKDPEFNQCIKQTYKKIERIKKIKQEIILYVLTILGHIKTEVQPIEVINIIPVYEYISEKYIDSSNLEQEPLYKHFRSNKEKFYEMYTLWAITNI
jgi:hypothetical protein